MPSFIEYHIASDIADCVEPGGNCSHSATSHNPFFLCSMIHADLLRFSSPRAEKLALISVEIVKSEISDYELVADKIETIRTIASINFYDKNKFLYSFAKAKRLGYVLLIKKNAPFQTSLEQIAGIFGVNTLII
ncbi:hypothetical protein AB4072_07055 [Microvirga sp. 2MCAF38]|uniref:hypothetical protein n=1 Tax=Microvirga sp. 2MCAF38 TaxID=3232989 RepID=UPI003F9AA425